jgi:putative PIN family toxin of toxin-antitoxin system
VSDLIFRSDDRGSLGSIVIDTSALVKRLSHRSRYQELLDMSDSYDIITSTYLLKECERILTKSFGFTSQSAKSAVRFFERISTTVKIKAQPTLIRDPTDEPILNLCHQHNVSILVSDDKDFTPELVNPTKLVTSADFFMTER